VWLLPFRETQSPPQRYPFETVDNIQKVATDQPTSKRSRQTSRGHFHMKTSSTATGSGNNFSGGVYLPKRTTLKGVMIFSSVVKKKL
jgi:hypothetical protein